MRRLFINLKNSDLDDTGVVVARVNISTPSMDEEYLNAKDLVASIQAKLDTIASGTMEQPEGFDMVSASAAWLELNALKNLIVTGNI